LDEPAAAMTYPPWRAKRVLLKDASFDPALTTPCTILSLDADGEEPPIELECWRELALKTEGLHAGDWIEFAFSSHWPHRRYSRLQEVGSYAEKWVCRAIYEMSRPPQTLRVPPAREGFWGPFEKLVYSEFARQVHRR
jgi:hypothetical protein